MLFMYYGQNWLAKFWKITELRKLRITVNPRKFITSRVSSTLSLISCKSHIEEND